jgi:hypothetical protein
MAERLFALLPGRSSAVSTGARQWAPAPGGIAVKCDPVRPARAWKAVAEELCDAVRDRGGAPPAARDAQSDAAGNATALRRGRIG